MRYNLNCVNIDYMNNFAKWLNANGYKRVVKENTISYPNYDFWKLVKEEFPNLKIIINADAHSPHSLNDDCVQKCFNLAKELDLNLIEHL